jgi:ferredoxin
MAYKVVVDKGACASVASCVAIATGTFKLDDDGLVDIVAQNGDPDDTILEAAKSCPTNAIKVLDDSGKQIYPET